MDSALSAPMSERFATRTQRGRVATALGATAACLALAGWFGGWAWVLPFLFVLLALLGEALFITLAALSLIAFGILQGSGFATDYGAGALVLLEMAKLTESPVLIAIPLFTLAGAIMTHGGISARLVRVMRAAVGWMPGGLAIATIVACAFFAALSGSSAVTIIAIGGMLAPTLERDYGKPFALGLLTSCGAIGILAPPSIPLILYGIVSGTDINQLFIAGIVPGLLTIGMLAVWCMVRGLDAPRQAFSATELWDATREGALALALPVLLLGGIFGGWVTAAEASVLAVVYAAVVEVAIHREVAPRDLIQITIDAMMLVGSILIILLMALALSSFLTIEQIPDAAAAAIGTTISTRFGFLLALNLLLLAVGCIMDIFSAIVVMTPLILPIATAYGVDPVHLGVIMVVNLELGFATPPFGINLFISSAFFRQPVSDVFRATVPFLAILLAGLALITWIESIALGLVQASGL